MTLNSAPDAMDTFINSVANEIYDEGYN